LSALKRSVVHAGLIVFALWPAAHIGLVKAWGVNPWKLAGWGMYSAPQIPPDLRISCFTPDEMGVYPLNVLAPELEATRHAFLRTRLGLGSLVRPTGLARALLDHCPAIDGVSIEVVQPVVNRRTGVIAERTTTYEYRR
jgi:hypothetical protein